MCDGPVGSCGRQLEASLETLKTHRSDGNDEGESVRLSPAFQGAQVRYSLSQESACLGPRAKFQDEVECLAEQSSLLGCPMLHTWLRSIRVGGWAAGW